MGFFGLGVEPALRIRGLHIPQIVIGMGPAAKTDIIIRTIAADPLNFHIPQYLIPVLLDNILNRLLVDITYRIVGDGPARKYIAVKIYH